MRNFLWRATLAVLHAIKWYSWVPLAKVIGRLRSTKQINYRWPNEEVQLGQKVVLFAHYDRSGFVREQVFAYLRALKEQGRDVVFVSNSERLKPVTLPLLQELCVSVLVRRNIGYDFGGWRDALDELSLPRKNTLELILANDSVFGPLTPLGDILRRLDFEKTDVWGLTESWQYRYHLQSFFIAFGPTALGSEAWRKFWNRVRPVPVKSYIMHAFETGLTQAMVDGGLRCAAMWRYDELLRRAYESGLDTLIANESTEIGKRDPIHVTRKLHAMRIRDGLARRVALNPTLELWWQLLLEGFPFIKRVLLVKNPTKVQDLGDWMQVVQNDLAIDPDPILLDLREILEGSAP
jgi:hypothetical protein